jgi:hypothetical protein
MSCFIFGAPVLTSRPVCHCQLVFLLTAHARIYFFFIFNTWSDLKLFEFNLAIVICHVEIFI